MHFGFLTLGRKSHLSQDKNQAKRKKEQPFDREIGSKG